jgi:S-adenosylmethionine decarboxylase
LHDHLHRLPVSRSFQHETAIQMRLDTMDALVDDASVLVDREGLRATLYAAASAGGARVIGEAFHVFPNGGVTGVLLLAQSHLSVHTWPELLAANVDLLSYGDVNGEKVLDVVYERLGARGARVASVARTVG